MVKQQVSCLFHFDGFVCPTFIHRFNGVVNLLLSDIPEQSRRTKIEHLLFSLAPVPYVATGSSKSWVAC